MSRDKQRGDGCAKGSAASVNAPVRRFSFIPIRSSVTPKLKNELVLVCFFIFIIPEKMKKNNGIFSAS
jgi:hypothetical protein